VALSDLFSRRRKEHAESEAGASDAPVHPTKVLARFIAGLSSRSHPVLLDLGPSVGSNLNFFGEELGCKIIVADLSKDIDRYVRDGQLEQFPAYLMKRFPQETDSIDGILCWDVFDYLDKKSAKALADLLVRVPNRDIQRLFEPLRIVEQFLLKTNLREILFRKAPEPAGTAPVSPSA